MAIIKLDQANKAVNITSCSLEHPLIFKYFDDLPDKIRDDEFKRALQIGVIALMEDRFAAFLSRTEGELGTQLESLKLIYERNVKAKEKTIESGIKAESEIFNEIRTYLNRVGHTSDEVQLTGSSVGSIKRNKTGDIVLTVNGEEDKKIAVEIKFDQSLALGEIEGTDSLGRPRDTALSQMLESMANRDAKLAIIVFDQNRSSEALKNYVNGISWIPAVGFVVIIDDDRMDYSNLFIAIDLARSMLLSTLRIVDQDIFESLLGRLSKDLSSIHETEKLIKANHDNLKKIATSIRKHVLLVGFTQSILKDFISAGRVSNEKLLQLYHGEGLKEKFAEISNDIEAIFPSLLNNQDVQD
jgi:hypothetical protein